MSGPHSEYKYSKVRISASNITFHYLCHSLRTGTLLSIATSDYILISGVARPTPPSAAHDPVPFLNVSLYLTLNNSIHCCCFYFRARLRFPLSLFKLYIVLHSELLLITIYNCSIFLLQCPLTPCLCYVFGNIQALAPLFYFNVLRLL